MQVRYRLATIFLVTALISVGAAPAKWTMALIAVWVVVAIAYLILAKKRFSAAARKFGGKILEFVAEPTPFDSLTFSLRRHGILISEVDCFFMMSADVVGTIEYFGHPDRKQSLFQILDAYSHMKAVIYGPIDETKSIQKHARMVVIPTKIRATEHINLISMKDNKYFVWYEPFHDFVDNKHHFTKGAYLIAIGQKKAKEIQEMYRKMSLTKGIPVHAQPRRGKSNAGTVQVAT